jgi:molybdopterin synthase catalytic subunit
MNFITFYQNLRTKISDEDGMLLVHNGIVKGGSREGKAVKKVTVRVNWDKLEEILEIYRKTEGISLVEAYIREGELYVGDDIMFLGVAGDVRENVINTLQAVLDRIKKEVTQKQEI